MSKMSELHAMLTQQAAELGFMSIEEAEANGYEVDYNKQELVPANNESELNKAHEAWLKERERVVGGLTNLLINRAFDPSIVESAIKFLKEQCHD